MAQRVVVAGSSGLIGGALCDRLRSRGDEVVCLVRATPAGADEREWDPASGTLPDGVLAGVDAVVNLAGAGIGDRRWSDHHKRVIERSRTDATDTLARAIAAEVTPSGRPFRFVNGSAVGFYGDRGEEILTESSPPGSDFLAGVVARWEAAARPASDAGASVALARTGLVMAPHGGAFAPLLRLARLGLAGALGSGRQWWPWVTLEDEVRALLHLLDHPELTGPANLAAPGSARQLDIVRAIGRHLHRPVVLPAPRLALRVIIGEFADGIVSSQRMVPEALLEHGFAFTHPDLESAVSWLLAR